MDIDLDSENFKLFIKKNIINNLNYSLSKKLKKYNFEEIDENIKSNIEINKSLLNYVKKINTDFNIKIENLEKKIDLFNNNINLLLISNTHISKENNNSSDTSNNKLNKFNKSLNNMSNLSSENNILNYNIGYDIDNDINNNIDNNIDKNIDNINNNNIIDNNNDNNIIDNNFINNVINIDDTNINNIFNNISTNISSNNLIYKDLKLEDIDLDILFIKKCLHSQSISSDLKIFKKIYIDNVPCGYYSIRNIKKKYQYWLNDKMNDDDDNGSYIKNTIVSNIYNAYLKINNYDNYADDIDQFVKNQEYILSINEQKYKDKLFNHIIKIIQIK